MVSGASAQTRGFPQTVCEAAIVKRKWWNWQTHHLEGVAPKGVGVQIPPSAPILPVTIPVVAFLLPSDRR